MRPSERLIERLRTDLGISIPEDATIERTYAGRHQLASGGWSWALVGNCMRVGSADRVSECLRADNLTIDYDEISANFLKAKGT